MISSALNAKKLIALSLCLSFLLTGGAWVVSDTNDTGNVATETDLSWEARTVGTRGDPILIRNVWDLQNMSNDLTADYALANDIDASATKDWNDGAGFVPVGSEDRTFTGSLDGRGHRIIGLYMNHSSAYHVGLFGYVGSRGSVSNVGLVDVDVTGKLGVGGLVGWNSGSVSNCYTTGDVTGYWYIGGLAGLNTHGGSLVNSHTTAHVNVTTIMADLIVYPSGNYAGGLVGASVLGSLVENCYATGNVNRNGEPAHIVGGLVGWNFHRSSVMNSYATGHVMGNTSIGGLVGTNAHLGSIANCYATGSVTGNEYVGGLVGQNGDHSSIMNSYARGTVTRSSGTKNDIGGFVGANRHNSRIINCYSTGRVIYEGADDPTQKGFCGVVTLRYGYEMYGNFWDMDTSGQIDTGGDATGKTTAEMKDIATFIQAGWEITPVPHQDQRNGTMAWNIVEGETYPFLSGKEVPRDNDDRGGGIRAIHVGVGIMVSVIAVGLVLKLTKTTRPPRHPVNRGETGSHKSASPPATPPPTPPSDTDPPSPEEADPPDGVEQPDPQE